MVCKNGYQHLLEMFCNVTFCTWTAIFVSFLSPIFHEQIVETMPQTEAVTEFLQKLDHFYEMVEDSENHNTLKMPGKPRLNGSVGANGLNESGRA